MQDRIRDGRGATPDEIIEHAFEALGIDAPGEGAFPVSTPGAKSSGPDDGHGAAALAEATALAAAARAAPEGADALVDLLAIPFVTIDNPGSRDLDQALHIERERHHGRRSSTATSASLHTLPPATRYRVRYALADAAHFVRPGSALFEAALHRGASYYAPGRVAPMLPRLLSEDLVSLGPGVERRALVFDMLLDTDGRLLSSAIVRARIRSRAQLTYRGVQAFLDGEPRADEPIGEPWADSLRLLRRVGTLLTARGRARGVVPFDRREARIEIAPATTQRPSRFVASERERLDVEEWNAQLSLLCNAEGAALLAGFDAQAVGAGEGEEGEEGGEEGGEGEESDESKGRGRAEVAADARPGWRNGLEPIYRVHAAPAPSSLRELRERLDAWADALGLDERFRWSKAQSLADFVDALPTDPRQSGRVRAVQRQILVIQRASEFSAEPGRHHALAVPGYARFSSPMREIVGIHVHRELIEALSGGSERRASARDEALRSAVIESSNAARRRQKALDKHIGFAVIADLLEADLEHDPVPAHRGTVLGVRGGSSRHLYIGIDDLALDLKVDAEDLRRRHGTDYRFEDFRAVPLDLAKSRFFLGDAVDLRAAGYDEARERFRLDVTLRGPAAGRERARARRRPD